MPPTCTLSKHSGSESDVVTETDSLAIEIRKKLGGLPSTTQEYPCIHRANGPVYRQKKDDFEPKAIAIGPYHHGKPNLQKMEDRKLYYLQQFLERSNALSLDNCVLTIRQMADKARKCYEEPINLEEDEFAEMLLLDGCFIIKFLHGCQLDESLQIDRDITRDLLLMENQLPLFVLDKLSPDKDILTPALRFVEEFFQLTHLETTREIRVSDIDHLLGLLHYRLSSTFPKTVGGWENLSWDVINSATELQEAGVQFKKTNTICLLDIKFEKGVLEMPQLNISPGAAFLFRNLITYEQCDPKRRHGLLFSDYITFMDCLINSSSDAELLRRHGIIESWVGDDETVCFLVNNISKEADVYFDFSYSRVFNKLNEHCKKRRHLWMATLRRNYFNSPWAIVSLAAAVVLLGLTAVQTIFSGLSHAG